MRREQLAFLADNPLYTKRFATFVGRRCRVSTIKDVAKELKLDWHTVKELDKQYMRAQLARAGKPGPRVIGIDEIAIRKGHTYRIVVSDLERRRPIWFGGSDRSEASMALFYDWLGRKKARASAWPSWTCGSRSATRRPRERRKPRFYSTSSTSCGTWARRSMPCARASTPASPAASGATSRGRSTRCSRAGRTCRWTADRRSASCSRPTSGSMWLTC